MFVSVTATVVEMNQNLEDENRKYTQRSETRKI